MLVAVLGKLSLAVLSFNSSHSLQERDLACQKFNDPTFKADAMVLTLSLGGSGLNLHKSCRFGIIAQESWSKPITRHAMGRLYRIRQTQPVEWTILRTTGTYHEILNDQSCRKYAEQIRFECRMPIWVKDVTLQRMIAYEMMRGTFAHPYNLYSWVVVPPAVPSEYANAAMERVGNFITLAVHYMTSVDKDDSALEQDMTTLAKHIRRACVYLSRIEPSSNDPTPDSWRTFLDVVVMYSENVNSHNFLSGRCLFPFWDIEAKLGLLDKYEDDFLERYNGEFDKNGDGKDEYESDEEM